jgi:hypothetical protein
MRGADVVLILAASPGMSGATKGGCSMASSYTRQPSAHMSDLASYGLLFQICAAREEKGRSAQGGLKRRQQRRAGEQNGRARTSGLM